MPKSTNVTPPPPINTPPAPQNTTTENTTTVYILGKLNAEGEEVSVGAAFSGDETVVLLEKPTKLGNALTIGAWLNNSWGTKVDALLVQQPVEGKVDVGPLKTMTAEQVKTHLDGKFPPEVTGFLSELFVADVYITDLNFRRWKEKLDGKPEVTKNAFKFGIAVDFKKGLTLLGNVSLTKAAIGIVHSPKDYDFSKATLPPLPQFSVPGDVEKLIKEVEAAAAEEEDDAADPPKVTAIQPKDGAT